MTTRASKFLDDHDEWLSYMRELPQVRLFRAYLEDQADYCSDSDRRFLFSVCNNMHLHITKVECGIRPPRRARDYREWNALRSLTDDAISKGLTLAEYIEDFEDPQMKIFDLRNPMPQ